MLMRARPVQDQARARQPSGREQLKCQWELLTFISREVMVLARRQQQEIGDSEQPLDPDWDRLFMEEREKRFAVWTARNANGTLVGYAFVFFTTSLWSRGIVLAMIKLFYLAPEWRSGWLGLKFMRSLFEAIDRLNPVATIQVETNDWAMPRVAILLERCNFKRVHTTYQR